MHSGSSTTFYLFTYLCVCLFCQLWEQAVLYAISEDLRKKKPCVLFAEVTVGRLVARTVLQCLGVGGYSCSIVWPHPVPRTQGGILPGYVLVTSWVSWGHGQSGTNPYLLPEKLIYILRLIGQCRHIGRWRTAFLILILCMFLEIVFWNSSRFFFFFFPVTLCALQHRLWCRQLGHSAFTS